MFWFLVGLLLSAIELNGLSINEPKGNVTSTDEFSLKRIRRFEFTTTLTQNYQGYLLMTVYFDESRTRKLLVDTSSNVSWIASPPVKQDGFQPAKLIDNFVCHKYRDHQLIGKMFTANFEVGRTTVKNFRFLSTTLVVPFMKLPESMDGSLGLAPSGMDTFWNQGGCIRLANGAVGFLSIEFTTRDSVKIKCERPLYVEGFTAYPLASTERWSIFVDSIAMGGVVLCVNNCEVSFELGLVHAFSRKPIPASFLLYGILISRRNWTHFHSTRLQ
ncbi:hypothetical protein CSKR_200224 [Clonorchis sinensis]|uniref:Peptidase A1 domain-containing protein n=1 Tax=Clonorchis sinensis TaxID=79923 RepID=A0A8T1M0D8_CLOSI|nr:hypothetical protein CSKR_200224 [Clonorchis sinensis]